MKGRHVSYSRAELAFIRSHQHMARRALHASFVRAFHRDDVSENHIRSLCTRNGWTTGRARWTAEDEALVRELYPDTSTAELARRLGRSLSATYGYAHKLGLAKSAAYLDSPSACRLRRGDEVGKAFRFSKGHAPANKGLRRPGWATGRMAATQFTKGQQGWNWKPIGTERIVDGYRYTKISDERRVAWTKNWKPTHMLLWETANGPIPEGHALKNLDGDRQNVDPSNWTLIPRGLLPRLNGKSGRRYDHAPAELRPSILAIARLEHAMRTKSTGS